jgi:hypothetical protein
MSAQEDWAAFRDAGHVTAKRAFMAGRESVALPGPDMDLTIFASAADFHASITGMLTVTETGAINVAPAPVAHALVKASSWVWGLAVLLSITAGAIGIITKSVPWCVAALVGAFVATFTVVARMSDGHDREAIKAATVTAGAFLYVGVLAGTAVAVVIVGWGK